MEKSELKSKIESLGHEKIARFMGCIYVNYLVWMNGGLHGYSSKALEKCEENARKNALESKVEDLVNAIIKGIERIPQTVTEEYYKKAYRQWFVDAK